MEAGVPVRVLEDVQSLAVRWGVPPEELLVAGGHCGEDTYYRALAAAVGLPFLARPVLSAGTRFPGSVVAGVAPLMPGAADGDRRFVTAPRGAQIAHLLARRLPQQTALALTSPSRLRQAVMDHQSDPIAQEAADALARADPTLSYRGGMERPGARTLALLAALLLATAWIAPFPVLATAGTLLGALFLAMAAIRIAAVLEPVHAAPAAALTDEALPVYSVIVPLHREAAVAARLVAALEALDYPAAKLDIKLVVEADDAATLAALREAAPGRMEILIAPPGAPRTKPRALNVALPLARGEHLVVYDAEDVPEPGQLRAAAARFARAPERTVCLQARLAIENGDDGWLARLFTIEYAALFDAVNPGLCALDLPVLLGGTSNHFRTKALRDLHGWDAWNVTEDADLGLRLARAGLVTEDIASTTWEEAPARLGPWLAQRTRWMKGFLQVCVTHTRRPSRAASELGALPSLAALAATIGTVLAALTYPLGLATFAWMMWDVSAFFDRAAAAPVAAAVVLCVFALTPVAVLVPAAVGLARRRAWRLAPWLVLLPVYCGLISLAAWRALAELALAPSRWNKTDHGLARTSRRHALKAAAADRPPLPAAGGSRRRFPGTRPAVP